MTIHDDVGPVPPPALAGYIVGFPGDHALVDAYVSQGAALGDLVRRVLGDRWPAPGARALDFGCGSGRVLRQFAAESAPGTLVGCDIDEDCVDWVAAHLAPGVEVHRSGVEPPLPFDDATFDVAWSMSVFSHLADSWARWLLELRRVVRPGGRLLVTVKGEASSEPIAGEPWDPDRIGMTVLGPGRPWAHGGPMVLHSEWWIRAHWGRAFDVVAFEAGAALGQDVVVLDHPGTPAPTEAELLAPEPGEPRELIAARHAVELAAREHIELNAQHDAYAAAYASERDRVAALAAERDALAAELARLRSHPALATVRRARRLVAAARRRHPRP